MTEQQVYVLDLKDASVASEYERHHLPGNVPPQVLDDIRAGGVVDMQIHRFGNRLVMITRGHAGPDVGDPQNLPETLAWERLMDRFQAPVAASHLGRKWQMAKKIFELSDHEDEKVNP